MAHLLAGGEDGGRVFGGMGRTLWASLLSLFVRQKLRGLLAIPRRAALEALWLHDAQKEHASVPAFSRISWMLAAVGAPADVALLAIEDGEFQLIDSQKATVTAKQRVVSKLTICRGKKVSA